MVGHGRASGPLSRPSRDFAASDEALRIRRLGEDNRITYKGPKRGGIAKMREEVEIVCEPGLEGFAKLSRIFEALGFRAVATVHKLRESFHLRRDSFDVEIALDHVEGIGEFVEIEALSKDAAELETAQRLVAALAVEFGLLDLEPRSYLRMTLESRASTPLGNPPGPT